MEREYINLRLNNISLDIDADDKTTYNMDIELITERLKNIQESIKKKCTLSDNIHLDIFIMPSNRPQGTSRVCYSTSFLQTPTKQGHHVCIISYWDIVDRFDSVRDIIVNYVSHLEQSILEDVEIEHICKYVKIVDRTKFLLCGDKTIEDAMKVDMDEDVYSSELHKYCPHASEIGICNSCTKLINKHWKCEGRCSYDGKEFEI